MIYILTLILLAAAAGGPPAACDPVLAALFTPVRPHVGRYEVCTASEPLGEDSEPLEALDAFGATGTYDRAKLARLYGGTRARDAQLDPNSRRIHLDYTDFSLPRGDAEPAAPRHARDTVHRFERAIISASP